VNTAKIVLPAAFNINQNVLLKQLDKYNNKIFLSIPRVFTIGHKEKLWYLLAKQYGINGASTIMPKCYILPTEYQKYKNDNGMFILKQNKQKQKGLKLTSKKISLKEIQKDKYLVAQKFKNNAFLFKDRKINIRLYLLLVCDKNGLVGYLSDDGIISYSDLKTGNLFDRNISSFYKSKKLYNLGYPITVKQFYNSTSGIASKLVRNSVNYKTRKLINAAKNTLTKNINFKNNRCCEIFGLDFFIDNNCEAWLLECNVAPGMKSHNSIDLDMRTKTLTGLLKIALTNNENKTIFKKII
jgi:hypothetical protein